MNQRDIRIGLIGLLGGMAFTAAGPVAADSYRIDAPSQGVEIGLGWDSQRNRLVPSRCINFAPIQEGGQHSTLDLEEVSDSAALRKHLGVSASAQIHGLAGSGSASASFVQDTNIKSSSSNFAVRASITNGVMFIGPEKPPALRRYAFSATQPVQPVYPDKPDPSTALNQSVQLAPWLNTVNAYPKDEKSLAAFRKRCGDGYVSAIYSGVELFTVISFESTDSTTTAELKAEISASYGVAAGSASYEEKTENQFKSSNTRLHFFQRGGAGGIVPTGRQELAQKLQDIAREATAAPEFFDIEITPYSDLPGWSLPPMKPGDNYTNLMVERYLQLKTLYRDLEDVIEKAVGPAESAVYMRCFSVSDYENMQDRIREAIALLEKTQIHMALNDWGPEDQNEFLTQLQKLQVDTPTSLVQNLRAGPEDARSVSAFGDERKDDLVDWLNLNLSIEYLRTLLPPHSNSNLDCKSKRREYQAAVIDQYIKPANTRVCADSLSDPQCLSNRALNILKRQVRYPSSTTLQPGAKGFLCIGASDPIRRCVAWLDGKNGILQLTRDISRAATVELKPLEDDLVELLVTKSPSETEEFTPDLFKRAQEGSYEAMYNIGENRGKDTKLKWRIMTIPGTDANQALRANTGGTYKRKKGTDCLLWEPNTDNVLVFPNNCTPGGSNIPHYTWVLYSLDELGNE
ncbi:MAG: hypothetical protein QNJ14_17155 [Woeseiaceae bacterium]|nr:hypothetical protein [Woeseiaceae bacterium]